MIKIIFVDKNKSKTVEDVESMDKELRKRSNYVRDIHFKQPEVIRQDTETIRNHVNTSTWHVRSFKSGIVIYPRPNKRKLSGVLIYWEQVAWVEAERDPAADDGWWK